MRLTHFHCISRSHTWLSVSHSFLTAQNIYGGLGSRLMVLACKQRTAYRSLESRCQAAWIRGYAYLSLSRSHLASFPGRFFSKRTEGRKRGLVLIVSGRGYRYRKLHCKSDRLCAKLIHFIQSPLASSRRGCVVVH